MVLNWEVGKSTEVGTVTKGMVKCESSLYAGVVDLSL